MGVSPSLAPSRTHVWLEGLGDWAWPGARPQPDPMPPAWVPSFPPRVALAAAGALPTAGGAMVRAPAARPASRRLAIAGVLCALTALSGAAALDARPSLERLAGLSSQARSLPSVGAVPSVSAVPSVDPAPSSHVALVSVAPGGSTIESVRYASGALHERGSFLVYLPPGFTFGAHRYPTLYLLHGTNESAGAFLELGLVRTPARLTAEGATPPLIAVMIQGGPGTNNWRDDGARGYESYVLEVQQLVDRMFPTLAEPGARAVAGFSV